MIIAGKEIPVKLCNVAVNVLEFDPENPRRYEIELEFQSKGLDPTLAKQPEAIERSPNFEQLVRAIVENKGISMPLVVEQIKGKFKLIDGDRRLEAVKKILSDTDILGKHSGLKDALAELPCIVVEKHLSEEERIILLSHIHMQLQQWKPASKGRALEKLESFGGTERAAAVMGITRGRVTKQLMTKELTKKFSVKGPSAHTYADRLLKVGSGLVDQAVVDATIEKTERGIITSPKDISTYYPKILRDPDAKKEFLKPEGSIEDAMTIVTNKEVKKALTRPSVNFKGVLSELLVALKNIKFDELTKYKGNEDIKSDIESCIEHLNQLKGYIA